jgi:hypothetical protein
MAKHKKKPDTSWMDDHDNAHFPDNPAVAKPRHKKHVAVLSAPKMKAKRIIKKRVSKKVTGK